MPITALILIVTSGIVHGIMTGRWASRQSLQPLAERLQQVPVAIGDWSATELEIPDDQLEMGEIDAYLSHRYINRSTGNAVNVLVVLGRPGPISVHTPDVCFRGAGYDMRGDPRRHVEEVPHAGPCEFRVGDFRKQGSESPENLRVYWSWSANGEWNAPTNPRFEFAGSPYLLKMYVIHSAHSTGESLKDDPVIPFLRAFVREVQHAVFDEV